MGSTFLSKNELAVKGNSYVGYLFQYKGRLLFSFYLCLAVWAMKKWYRDNDRMTARMNELLQRLMEMKKVLAGWSKICPGCNKR